MYPAREKVNEYLLDFSLYRLKLVRYLNAAFATFFYQTVHEAFIFIKRYHKSVTLGSSCSVKAAPIVQIGH